MKCCETSAVCLKCKWRAQNTEVREMCSGLGGDAGDGKESEWKHWRKWIKMCPANLRGTIVSARCAALRYMTEDVIWQHLTGRYEKRRTWWTCCLLVHEERRSTGNAGSCMKSVPVWRLLQRLLLLPVSGGCTKFTSPGWRNTRTRSCSRSLSWSETSYKHNTDSVSYF